MLIPMPSGNAGGGRQRTNFAAGLATPRTGDDGDVPDPYTGTRDDFVAVLALIRRGVEAMAVLVADTRDADAIAGELAAGGLDNIRRHFSAEAARGVVRRVFFD